MGAGGRPLKGDRVGRGLISIHVAIIEGSPFLGITPKVHNVFTPGIRKKGWGGGLRSVRLENIVI